MLTMILMYIGGTSGSTAGGLKTTTFAVLIITKGLFIGSTLWLAVCAAIGHQQNRLQRQSKSRGRISAWHRNLQYTAKAKTTAP